MENASKALIIAAAVLVAVAIMSIFIYVFTAIGDYNAQSQAQLQSSQITAANRFFVESAYDVNSEKNGVQIYGYDVYNILRKASDINENPNAPVTIEIDCAVSKTMFVASDGILTEGNKMNLKKQYTYSYSFDSEGYINKIIIN